MTQFLHCRRLCNTTGFLLFGLYFENVCVLENGLLTQCIALTGRSPVHTPMCFSDTTSPILGNGSRNRDPSKLIRLSWATGTEYVHKIRLYSGQIRAAICKYTNKLRLFSSQICKCPMWRFLWFLNFNFSQQSFLRAPKKSNQQINHSIKKCLLFKTICMSMGKNIYLHNDNWVTTFFLSGIFQLRLIFLIRIRIRKGSHCGFLLTITCRQILVLFQNSISSLCYNCAYTPVYLQIILKTN